MRRRPAPEGIVDPEAILDWMRENLVGVDVVEARGDFFVFYNPGGEIPDDHRFPFATLVTADRYDQVSALDRPGVYRLNLGVGAGTYRSLFGPPPSSASPGWPEEAGYDFAELDRLMPHPVYAGMHWICVLNPSPATWDRVRPLLTEAHERARRRSTRRKQRSM